MPQLHAGPQLAVVQLPDAAQLSPHAPVPHATVEHDGTPAQFTLHFSAPSQCTMLHADGPVHCATNVSAEPPLIVPRHELMPLHWIVQVGDIAQSIVPAQLLSAAHTSRHGTDGGHVQSVGPQLMMQVPMLQFPLGQVIAEHASTSASACASTASATPPASSPCVGEKPMRPQPASAIRTTSERRSKTVSPNCAHQGKAPEILRG
jgi:hypothetical protein